MAIEMHQTLGHGFDFHHMFGAYCFTGTAPHTFFRYHDRVTLGTHFQCTELTCPDAVSQSDASDAASPLASG